MRSLRYKRVPGTTKAITTKTRKTDLPCHEIGRLMAASLSKPNEDRCVYVALLLLACRFLGAIFWRILIMSPSPPILPSNSESQAAASRTATPSPASGDFHHLLDIDAAIGGAHPHINACGRTLENQVMGAARAGVHHQGRVSSSATRRGLIRSLMRLASRSSSASGAAPISAQAISSW